jgi:hypothetical protein
MLFNPDRRQNKLNPLRKTLPSRQINKSHFITISKPSRTQLSDATLRQLQSDTRLPKSIIENTLKARLDSSSIH